MAAPELRVLIVEDQEEARLLSAALLERHGLRVCGLARDGLEALVRIRSERPDAVVLDLILPGLDGLGLLRALGRRDGGPVVVVTSQISDPAVSSLACRLGANYYYIKPVNFEELASLLRSICPGPGCGRPGPCWRRWGPPAWGWRRRPSPPGPWPPAGRSLSL